MPYINNKIIWCVTLLLSWRVDCRVHSYYIYTFAVYNLFQFVFQNGFCVNNKHYNMTILYRSELLMYTVFSTISRETATQFLSYRDSAVHNTLDCVFFSLGDSHVSHSTVQSWWHRAAPTECVFLKPPNPRSRFSFWFTRTKHTHVSIGYTFAVRWF